MCDVQILVISLIQDLTKRIRVIKQPLDLPERREHWDHGLTRFVGQRFAHLGTQDMTKGGPSSAIVAKYEDERVRLFVQPSAYPRLKIAGLTALGRISNRHIKRNAR